MYSLSKAHEFFCFTPVCFVKNKTPNVVGQCLISFLGTGIKEPRHAVRGRNLMPNPREVSVALCYQNDQSDVQKTMAVMQWSQFIAHDMAHTPVRKMGKLIVLYYPFCSYSAVCA